jgi:hypothetical protein
MVRWWWFGSTNTKNDVDQQLDAMVKAGIGGVELSCVYPIAQNQPTTYGSDDFLEVVRHASTGAKKRGMRFDMTLGSGWSFGGAHVSAEHASKRLRFEDRAIGPEEQRLSLAGRWPGDKLIAAWICEGAMGEHTNDYRPLKIKDGIVSIPSGGSPRTLLLATSGPTTQQLKRASNGAEGPTLDHYSREATVHHLKAVGEPFLLAAGGAENVTAVFCDSLEAYSADWTPGLEREFQDRRGYDPTPFLYHIHLMSAAGTQFRADFYKTLSEILEDNFLSVCQEWASQQGVSFRVQNYGAPPARISGFKHADMIEGEQWGWLKIPQSKWASSAAHYFGNNVVSSETWTWLNSPSFRARPLDFKGEAHEQALSGINHFIGHGWPSSPLNTVSPGWAFYAACAISNRNEWWQAGSISLFSYLQRLSETLRHGEYVADVGLWMPYDDTYADFTQEHELNLWRLSARRLGVKVPQDLRQAGYDFDVFDGGISKDTLVLRHKVVVVAGSDTLSPSDDDLLQEIAHNGVTVLVVDSKVLPWAIHVTADQLVDAIKKVIPPDAPTNHQAVGAIHRRLADAELYFVANTSADSVDFTLKPRTPFDSWERWDIHDGSVTSGAGGIESSLHPYEAYFYITRPGPSSLSSETSTIASKANSTPIELRQWRYRLNDGVESIIQTPHAWTDQDDTSGTAIYTTTIDLNSNDYPSLPSHLILDTSGLETPPRTAERGQAYQAHSVDPIGVVAKVTINGKVAGILWDPPYRLAVGHLLETGSNTIELAVSSTSIADTRAPEWRQIYADAESAHGRRFIMQDIDSAFEPTRSGLLVVPHLI